MTGERALIEQLQRYFPPFTGGFGIGDDAAIMDGAGPLIVTTDMLVEDVDFTSSTPVKFVAVKSLAANLSDLAAMGATPAAFLLALAFPSKFLSHFSTFAQSLAQAADRWQVELIGGDLSRAGKLTISITALGRMSSGARPLMRSGARPGDRIFVSRPVGGSATGLHLLTQGWSVTEDAHVLAPPGATVDFMEREVGGAAIMRHIAPEPETVLGPALARTAEVSACIDLSDGLSSDLGRLCEASEVGALIDWDRVPAFPDLPRVARSFGISLQRVLLHGGEEFSLLFTSSLREAELSSRFGRPVYSIGVIRTDRGIMLLRDGREEELRPEGFDHFSP